MTSSATQAQAFAWPGALGAVLRHGWREAESAREEAAWVLAVLGAEPGCAPVVADSAASFDLLRVLTTDAEASVRLQGAWALANLTLLPAGCERAIETVGVAPLVHALHRVSARGGADAGEEAHQLLRCLASLLTAAPARKQLIHVDDVPGTLQLLLQLSARDGASGARGAGAHGDDGDGALDGAAEAEAVAGLAMRCLAHACAHPCSAATALLDAPGAIPSILTTLRSGVPPGMSSQDCNSARVKRQLAAVTTFNHLISAAVGDDTVDVSATPRTEDVVLKNAGAPAATRATEESAGRKASVVGRFVPAISVLVSLLATSEDRGMRLHAAVGLGRLGRCTVPTDAGRLDMLLVDAGALPLLRSLRDASGEDHAMERTCGDALAAISSCLTPTSRRVYYKDATDANPRRRGRARPSKLSIGAPRSHVALGYSL